MLIIKDIIETIRSNEPINRENRHSFVVACRTNIELVKFEIEYKQSTGMDTRNSKKIFTVFFLNFNRSLTVIHCIRLFFFVLFVNNQKYRRKF